MFVTGSLSEEGLLLYLNALQTLLPLLPVTESTSRADINSDSEDEEEMNIQFPATQVNIHTLCHKDHNKIYSCHLKINKIILYFPQRMVVGYLCIP